MHLHVTHIVVLAALAVPAQGTFPTSGDVSSILKALEKIVKFYGRSIDQTNLDGLYGLRVIEGTLQNITKSDIYRLVDASVKDRLNQLLSECQEPIQNGIEVVKRESPDVFKELQALIVQPYIFNYVPRNIRPELRWSFVLNSRDSFKAFDESQSDHCFGILFKARKGGHCVISSECLRQSTVPNLISYPLTHQLLFSIEADKSKECAESWQSLLNSAGYRSNTEFQRIWCTNSYYETLGYVRVGRNHDGKRLHFVSMERQDLFFEHLFVCPSIGYHEFLKEEYLHIILNAQDSSGCFTDQDPQNSQPTKRKLMEEQETKDGCLFHMTAVASGALTVYLRLALSLRHESEKLRLSLQSDNRDYLESVKYYKLKYSPRSHPEARGSSHYKIVFLLVFILFMLWIWKRRAGPCKRLFHRMLG